MGFRVRFWKKNINSQISLQNSTIFNNLAEELVTLLHKGIRGWQPRAVEIGDELFKLGGRNWMLFAFGLAEKAGGQNNARILSICWQGIGNWDANTGAIQLGPTFEQLRAELSPMHSLGRTWEQIQTYAKSCLEAGLIDDAIKQFLRAIECALIESAESRELVASYANLGVAYERNRDWQMAESFYNKALNMAEKLYGVEDMHTADVLHVVAQFYLRRGDLQRFAALDQRANEISGYI